MSPCDGLWGRWLPLSREDRACRVLLHGGRLCGTRARLAAPPCCRHCCWSRGGVGVKMEPNNHSSDPGHHGCPLARDPPRPALWNHGNHVLGLLCAGPRPGKVAAAVGQVSRLWVVDEATCRNSRPEPLTAESRPARSLLPLLFTGAPPEHARPVMLHQG